MKILLALITSALLAGCGQTGALRRPEPKAPPPVVEQAPQAAPQSESPPTP